PKGVLHGQRVQAPHECVANYASEHRDVARLVEQRRDSGSGRRNALEHDAPVTMLSRASDGAESCHTSLAVRVRAEMNVEIDSIAQAHLPLLHHACRAQKYRRSGEPNRSRRGTQGRGTTLMRLIGSNPS